MLSLPKTGAIQQRGNEMNNELLVTMYRLRN
jgi:hypothetical protein